MPSILHSTSAGRDSPRGSARALLTILLVLPLAPAAGAAGGGGGDGPVASESSLVRPLRTIRTAVLARDSARLLRCFEPNQPIFVKLSSDERGALLGPGPLDALVRRLLADRESVSFDVSDVPDVPAEASRAFVTVEWTYRSSASSTLHVDHLHLVLSHAPEHAEWLIVEMKTSSR